MTCRSPSVHIRKGWPGAVSKSITSKRSFAAGKKGRKEKADGVKTETPFFGHQSDGDDDNALSF